jgi:hypothetical protein
LVGLSSSRSSITCSAGARSTTTPVSRSIGIRDPGGSDFLGIPGEFVQRVTEQFERARITIPYPHRTIEGNLGGPEGGEPGVPAGD